MADPVGGIGKASQQMMQEMQKQMQEVSQQQGPEKTGGANFAQQVNQVQDVQQVQEVQKTMETQKTHKATDVLRTAQAQGMDAPGAPPKVEAMSKTQKGFNRLLGEITEGQSKLDDIIKMATSGKRYSQQDLLAIQASVYKFSQELDLTSKVVEKATSGIKQTMQTQV